ncbi:MAG: DUF4136 domain-containing protein, partial [Xanthomonadales bacterium]
MKPGSNSNLIQSFIGVVILAVFLAACAPSVKVRSDADPTVDFSQYQTYGFFSQMGVEGDNYSGLLGQHFRGSVSSQLDRRGFKQSDSPELQINVSIGAEDKVRVNTYQDPYLHGGYYRRGGYGHYGGMGMGYPYGGGTRTTVHQYTEAKVYIDLVDSEQHKVVWQGVATFTVTDKIQENIRKTVYDTVDKIFTQFPIAAP